MSNRFKIFTSHDPALFPGPCWNVSKFGMLTMLTALYKELDITACTQVTVQWIWSEMDPSVCTDVWSSRQLGCTLLLKYQILSKFLSIINRGFRLLDLSVDNYGLQECKDGYICIKIACIANNWNKKVCQWKKMTWINGTSIVNWIWSIPAPLICHCWVPQLLSCMTWHYVTWHYMITLVIITWHYMRQLELL